MFRSISVLDVRAKNHLSAYYAFLQSADTKSILSDKGEVFVAQLEALQSHVDYFRNEATAIAADPSFSSLAADVQGDITDLIEACAGAKKHVETVTHPDAVWATLDHNKKRDAVARHLAQADHRAVMAAHLRFDVIKQKAQSPKGDAK
jgi:hypothetical protein